MLKKANIPIVLVFLGFFSNFFGQRTIEFQRIDEKISLDGQLNEVFWKEADFASDFITNYPEYGKISDFRTEVAVKYDNENIYVAARLFDPKPDSVLKVLSQRDDFGNADWFGILIDPYGGKQNGFAFYVTAAGVELDALINNTSSDFSWNAIWRSDVVITDFGFTMEIKIPLAAIRFPEKEIQTWHVNFVRQVRRCREQSYWNPVNPELEGELIQSGNVTGVKHLKAPLRLALIPYVSGYLDKTPGTADWSNRIAGGMDLKYGINNAYTLDMTLIPDFGQTISDNQVLNLSPFEVRFNENRPFFQEGLDLFNIGGVFYSRRVGGTPFYFGQYNTSDAQKIQENPSVAPLVNATKVSGRSANGLGLGFFNAIEGETHLQYTDTLGNERRLLTNPLTNYNIVAASQNLKNNSSISILNSNVMRAGEARDANVTAFESVWYTPQRNFQISHSLKVSALSDEGVGHSASMGVRKVSGETNYGIWYYEESPTYDINDLGFLQANNSRSFGMDYRVNRFKPKGRFLRRYLRLNYWYEQLYSPDLYASTGISGSIGGTTRKFLSLGFDGGINPIKTVNHFEARKTGWQVNYNPNAYVSFYYSSDYSRPFALDFSLALNNYFNQSSEFQGDYSWRVSPRLRIGNRTFLVWSTSYNALFKDYGYVRVTDTAYSDEIMLGMRNRDIVENSLRTEIVFTKRMGMNIRLRHYWQGVRYDEFQELQSNGWGRASNYSGLDNGLSLHNTNYNALTLDVQYQWVFFPGSTVTVFWKYNLFAQQTQYLNYFDNFDLLFQESAFNSLSVKFLYFLDVLYLKRKRPSNR